jgi:GH25 family lysozyme M1 (1,4-beta-N-acetylmuramidase)
MKKYVTWIFALTLAWVIFTWPVHAFAMESRSNADLRGIDVSHWDGTINWREVAASHVQFAYIKATGDNSFVDGQFRANVRNARASGIAVGAYHYAKPSAPFNHSEPVRQANLFVETMRSSMHGFGDIMPVLDFEESGGLSAYDLDQWIRVFVSTVEHQTNRKVMLYTSEDFIQRHANLNSGLSAIPLWVAYYDRLNGGRIPPNIAGWSHWLVWQYSDQGAVTGLSGHADVNAGPTSLSALRGYLPGGQRPANPASPSPVGAAHSPTAKVTVSANATAAPPSPAYAAGSKSSSGTSARPFPGRPAAIAIAIGGIVLACLLYLWLARMFDKRKQPR